MNPALVSRFAPQIAAARQAGIPDAHIANYLMTRFGGPAPSFGPSAATTAAPAPVHHGGILSSLISEGGGVLGGIIGAPLGPLGIAAGAGIGSTLGRVAENKVRDNRYGIGDALKEGAVTGALSLGGEAIGAAKGARNASKLAKAGIATDEAARAVQPTTGLVEGIGKSIKGSAQGYGIGARLGGDTIGAAGSDAIGQTLKTLGVPATSPEAATRLLEPRLQAIGNTLTSQYARGAMPLTKSELGALGDRVLSRVAAAGGLGTTADKFAEEQVAKLAAANNTTDLWNFTKQLEKHATNFGANPSSKLVEKEGAARIIRDEIRSVLNNSVPGVADTNNLYHSAIDAYSLLKKGATDVKGGGLFGKLSTLGPVRSAEAKLGAGLETAGRLSAGTGGTLSQATRIGKIQAPGAIGRAVGGLYSSDSQPTTQSAPQITADTNSIVPSNSITDALYAASANQGSSGGITRDDATRAMLTDIQATGGKNIAKIQALFNFATPENKPLNSTSAGIVADTQSGIQDIRSLSEALAQSNVNGPGIGQLRSKNPFDTNAQSLQAHIALVKQIIGKAVEGGVLRKEDELKYAKILPTIGDTDATAQAKVKLIADALQQKLDFYQQALGRGGGGTSLDDLLLAQSGQ